MNSSISTKVRMLTGAGHCDGEEAIWLTNNSTNDAYCEVVFERNGVLLYGGAGTTTVRAGQTTGGEMTGSGGMWECDHTASDRVHYACVRNDDPDSCKVDMVKKTQNR